MVRKPRIHIPRALYHVMLRGNGGQPIFFSDKDRCRLCLLIQEGIGRHLGFKSILVDEASYLSELVRYIHLSPVRASFAESPEDYAWSGHLTYLGRSPNRAKRNRKGSMGKLVCSRILQMKSKSYYGVKRINVQ